MSLKAVLFDMDGVIVDTEPLHRKAWENTFDDFSIPMSEGLYESFTGQSTVSVAKQLAMQYGKEVMPETLVERKRAYFKKYFHEDNEFDLLPGVLSLIQELYDNAVTLVVASSASMNTIQWVFDKFNLTPYFRGKISGAELERSKPDPEIFIRAAALAQAPVQSCIVIEDSTNGIIAAKRANIYTIGYDSPHSKKQDYSLADKVIFDFNELNYKKMNSFVAEE